MKTENLTEQLVQVGLSEEEALMFLALLEIGETTAGALIKKTGFHRQVAYNTLERLVERDLASVTVKKNKKHWMPGDPNVILGDIEKKALDIQEIIPKLLSMQELSKHKQEVRIYEGAQGLANMQMSNLLEMPLDETYYVIGSSPKLFTKAMTEAKKLELFEKTRMERRMRIKLIFSEMERKNAQWVVKTYFKDQPEEMQRIYRYLPERRESPVGIHVWTQKVALITYGTPLLCIEIKNELLAKEFLSYFEYLWKLTKK